MGLAKTFLAMGISVLFVIFIGYGLHVFYELPEYDYNACYDQYDCYTQFEMCDNLTDPDIEVKYDSKADYECRQEVENSEEYIRCEEDRQVCEDAYLLSSDRYKAERNSFYILIIIGLASIIAGIYLSKLEGIGSGLIGGGVLVIIWSLMYTSRYWLTFSKYFKLIALGVVLVLLFYLGYKKLDNMPSNAKKNNPGKRKKSKR